MDTKGINIDCDNPGCDYSIPLDTIDQLKGHADKPCPKCGKIILTSEAVQTGLAVYGLVETIEKVTADVMGLEVPQKKVGMEIRITDKEKKS